MAGAPGRWLYRGRKLGGALILSFSGRSSFPSLPSLCPLPSISWAALALLSDWLGGLHRLGAAGSPSVLLLALVAVLASLGAGAGRCPLPILRPLPLLGAGSGLWCCCLPLPSLLGAGVPLLSSGAGLLCAGAGLSRPWRWWLAGGWCALIWRAFDSSCCTNKALQVWLLFKVKAINFERFFLDTAHKVRYNNTRVKEIVNPLQLTASPLLGGG